MAKVRINAIDINYEIYGKGEPLVLLTGITGSIDHYWVALLPHIKHKYQVLVLDNRGMGKTEAIDGEYSIAMMAEDTMKLIRHCGLQTPSILGHSMGSCIAMEMARSYPEELDKLILVNPLAQLIPRSIILFESTLELLKVCPFPEKVMWSLVPWLFSEKHLSNEKLLEDLRKFISKRKISLESFIRQFNALNSFDATQWIKEIALKTLVIGSKEDLVTPLKLAKEISEQIKNSQLVILEGAHASNVEKAPEIAKEIGRFLNR